MLVQIIYYKLKAFEMNLHFILFNSQLNIYSHFQAYQELLRSLKCKIKPTNLHTAQIIKVLFRIVTQCLRCESNESNFLKNL